MRGSSSAHPRAAEGLTVMPALLLSVFLDLVGFGLILPLLPFYARTFNASALQIMLLTSTFSVAQMIAAPLWGHLSDRLGRRPVLLGCLCISVVSYGGLALASSLPALFAARALSGFASGKISIAEAWVADVTPPERRSWGMGLIGAAMGAGYVVGPALGGLLARNGSGSARWQTPVWIAAALALAALVVAVLTLQEPPVRGRGGARPATARRAPPTRLLSARPGLAALIVLHLIVSFVFTLVEAVFPLWAEHDLSWGAPQVGAAFAAIGVLIVAAQAGLVGPLTQRLGETRLMLAGMGAVALGVLSMPAVAGVGLLAVVLGLTSIGIATVMPSMTSLITRLAPEGEQGAVLGMANTAAGAGRILGPAWAGWALEHSGQDLPYLSSGVLMLGALFLLMRTRSAVVRTAP